MSFLAFLMFFGLFGVCFGFLLPGAFVLSHVQSRIHTSFARKKIKDQTVLIAEYEIPNELSPVEASHIFYGRYTYDTEKAMLFELQELGAVSLKFQSGNLEFQTLVPKDPLEKTYHQMFYDKLPGSGQFLPNTFNKIEKNFIQIHIRDSLASMGYTKGSRFPKRILLICGVISLTLAVLLGILTTYVSQQSTEVTGITNTYNGVVVDHFDFATALTSGVAFGFMVLVFSFPQVLFVIGVYYNRLGIPANATKKLKDTWIKVIGYREYLIMVEQDNLKDDIKNGYTTDNKLLSYAIGLNVVDLAE